MRLLDRPRRRPVPARTSPFAVALLAAFALGATEPERAGQATAARVTNLSQLCQGDMAQGRLGDYVLDNGRVRAVIAGSPRGDIQTGALLDVGVAPYYIDYFLMMEPGYGPTPLGRIALDALVLTPAAALAEGRAGVEARGVDAANKQLAATVRYEIDSKTDAVVVTTLIENGSKETIKRVEPRDRFTWGGLTPFAPLNGVVTRSFPSEGDWIGAFVEDACLGVTAPAGPLKCLHEFNANLALRRSVVSYQPTPALTPGGSVEWRRRLYVGGENFAAIANDAYRARKTPTATIQGRLTTVGTGEPVTGCPVRILYNPEGKPQAFTWAVSDEEGRYRVDVPPGSYVPWPEPKDRARFGSALATLPLEAGASETRDFTLDPPAFLTYKILDKATGKPCPAKLTFTPIPTTPEVDFGPPYDLAARNAFCTATGEGEIPLTPGRYLVTISRGPEYDIERKRVSVTRKGRNLLMAGLDRVVDTKGYVCVDIGALTTASYDGLLTPEERLVTAAAEGVEVVITGDDGVATDLSSEPVMETLKPHLKTFVGKRVRPANLGRPGHYMVYPVDPKLDHAALTEKENACADSLELARALREHYPGAVLQLNRPIFPDEGLFSTAGYKHDLPADQRELPSSKTISYDFDVLEVMEGKRLGLWDYNLKLAMDLIREGYRPGMTGSSYSRAGYGQEIGYPRTYVMSSTDDPSKVDIEEIVANIKAGKVVITNGPFVHFGVNGQPLGGLAKAENRRIEGEMRVLRAPWVDVGSIDVLTNGVFSKKIFVPPGEEVVVYPKEKNNETPYFPMMAIADQAINITVKGRQPLAPVVTNYLPHKGGGVSALCATGFVYVDGDGDGLCQPKLRSEK